MSRECFTPSEYSGVCAELFAEDSLEQNLTVRSLLGLSFKPCGLAFGIDKVSTICIFTVARCKPANRWCICSARIKMFTIGFSTKMDPRVLCDRVRRKLYGAILPSARIVSLRELPCHLTVIFQSTKRIFFFNAARVGTCISSSKGKPSTLQPSKAHVS